MPARIPGSDRPRDASRSSVVPEDPGTASCVRLLVFDTGKGPASTSADVNIKSDLLLGPYGMNLLTLQAG
jgi:hypothetical protein